MRLLIGCEKAISEIPPDAKNVFCLAAQLTKGVQSQGPAAFAILRLHLERSVYDFHFSSSVVR